MNERGLRVQSGMERWLDTERHLARFPRREHGEAKVIEYGVTALQTEMEMRRYMTHVVWTPPGRYLKLVVGEELWMSNTRMEYLTNFPFIEHAMGEILIAGLGLGLVLDQLIGKEWVGHIDVVEKHPDVYELVGAAWVDHPKVNLHLGDIYTWRPPKGKQYDRDRKSVV